MRGERGSVGLAADLPGLGGERGSVGLAAVLSGLAFTVVGLVIVVAATDVGLAAARARTAADAAALAGAGALPLAGGDGDVRSAAETLAEANGARLVGCCTLDAGGPRVVVTVEVSVRSRLAAVAARSVRMRAAAGLRPPDQAGEPARASSERRESLPGFAPRIDRHGR